MRGVKAHGRPRDACLQGTKCRLSLHVLRPACLHSGRQRAHHCHGLVDGWRALQPRGVEARQWERGERGWVAGQAVHAHVFLHHPTCAVHTRLCVALSPTTPHAAAGMRMLPPPSLPTANGTSPAATAAALPLLLPPVWCPGACGLRAVPVTVLSPVVPSPGVTEGGRGGCVGAAAQRSRAAACSHLPPPPADHTNLMQRGLAHQQGPCRLQPGHRSMGRQRLPPASHECGAGGGWVGRGIHAVFRCGRGAWGWARGGDDFVCAVPPRRSYRLGAAPTSSSSPTKGTPSSTDSGAPPAQRAVLAAAWVQRWSGSNATSSRIGGSCASLAATAAITASATAAGVAPPER